MTAKQDHTIQMGKVILFVVILTVIIAGLAVAASLSHGVEFDNWAAVAAFFYVGAATGAVIAVLMTMLLPRGKVHR